MTYFNGTIRSNVHISHPTIELAHYAWILAKALMLAETFAYFITHPQKIAILLASFFLLFLAYKFNEIK